MFKLGEFYLVAVRTGKLSFETDGQPKVSESEYLTILHFGTQEKARLVIDTVKKVPPAEMKPGTIYHMMFKAPVPIFDEKGMLIPPKFTTEGFYNGEDVSKVAPWKQDVFELCEKMPETVLPFFKDEDQAVCPLTV